MPGTERLPQETDMAAAAPHKDSPQSPDAVFTGYLRKRYATSMYMGSWRFCVLQGARLRWYRSEEQARSGAQVRGEAWLQAVEPWDGRGALSLLPHAFAVRTVGKRLLLCSAESAADRDAWLEHLEGALRSAKAGDNVSTSTQTPSSDDDCRRVAPVPASASASVASSPSTSTTTSTTATATAATTATATAAPPPTPASLLDERPATVSDATSIRSAPPALSPAPLCVSDGAGCTECGMRFRALVARRVVCGSCARSFCGRHCARGVRLPQLGVRAAQRCCDRCAQRQQLVVYLRAATRFLRPLAGRGVSLDELLTRRETARGNHSSGAGTPEMQARTLRKLRRGPMTLNRTVKILYQTRKKPALFRVACERLPFYAETCVDRVENLWYQVLHLVQCLDAEPAPRAAVQLFYLTRYIRAICRRSPRIALQTIWHVQAAVGDGGGTGCHLHPHSLLALLGFLYPTTTSEAAETNAEGSRRVRLWKELLLAQCPPHQVTEILSGMRQMQEATQALEALQPDSMIERWLQATTVPQFEASAAELARSGIELCEFQSSILYDSLEVEGSELDAESPATRIEALVLEQVSFVQSLAAISERLRHVQPVQDRGKYLTGELETLNATLSASALYPLSAASDELYQVVRIPPTEGKVFSTKMRAPTLIFVETVPVQSATAVEDGSADIDRLRPFMCSSQPRNSTFFESVLMNDGDDGSVTIDDGESSSSAVSSGCETLLSPSSSSTLATPSDTGREDSYMSCPDDLASLHAGAVRADSKPTTRASERKLSTGNGGGGFLGRHMTFPSGSRESSASGRRHTTRMHLPNPSRGSKLGGGRGGRLGVENFVYDSKVFGESWEERKARIQRESPVGDLPGWDLFSVIVKTNDDLRQEVFTMQLIHKFKSIFEFEAPHLWLRTYRIVATGAGIGLLETITDACSLDHLKKTFSGGSLSAYFSSVYGAPGSDEFAAAQRRFIESMAAYSIVSYVLLLKDRHNGNILLSAEGRVIHIDFGFILGIAPGGMFSVEDAPFKLTKDMVDVMGGVGSSGYHYFRDCLCDGFSVLQKYQAEIAALLQTTGQHSPFPCFDGAKLARIIADLRVRLCVGLSRRGICQRVDQLLRKSYNAWGTRQYDSFQLRSNNIHP